MIQFKIVKDLIFKMEIQKKAVVKSIQVILLVLI